MIPPAGANITYTMVVPYGTALDPAVYISFLFVIGVWGLILWALHRKEGMSNTDRVLYSIIFLLWTMAMYNDPVVNSITLTGQYHANVLFFIIAFYEIVMALYGWTEGRKQ